MWRGLVFLLVLGTLSFGAVWLADRPGSVTVEWQGYYIETSFAVMVAVVSILAAGVALLYRGWIFLVQLPGNLRRKRQEAGCRKGYLALTRGLVAVAAGDAQGVHDQAWRVGRYLKDPPLTLLLSAQAAQLSGDDRRAARDFRAMLDNPETEFFGLRGLILQSMKRGDWAEARLLAERAHKVNPRSEWVASSLLTLQARAGRWDEAQGLLEGAAKSGRPWTAPERKRRQAVVEYELGVAAEENEDRSGAQRHLRKALDLRPDFIAAADRLARILVAAGKGRKAASEIEAVWRRLPHADLFEAYCLAKGVSGEGDQALERAKAAQRLARLTPASAEAHVIAARALLDAMLWGEARKHLAAAMEAAPTARVFRMLAEVEEREPEQGDADKAHDWWVKAASAPSDPAWTCDACGGTAPAWQPVCPHCHGFDTLAWKAPAPVLSEASALFAAKPDQAALPAPSSPS